jgi:hypothetical protein
VSWRRDSPSSSASSVLAFTSCETARTGAETEALIVAQQVETAQFFEPATATD